jgi:Inositol hexakisphosphate
MSVVSVQTIHRDAFKSFPYQPYLERILTFIRLVYIAGRPFVLRDASEPRRTLSISDRPENLEAIENRLKNDILQEAVRYVVEAHAEELS